MGLALFDLDGTIVRGQSQILLLRYLARMGVVGKPLFVKICFLFLLYKAGFVEARKRPCPMLPAHHDRIVRERMSRLLARFYDNVLRHRLCPPL
jgi:phosphoserine phosphatase